MTYREYKKWANEYLQQAKVLEEKIERHRRIKTYPSAAERERDEKLIQQMYEMRRDCLYTYKLLMNEAEELRAREETVETTGTVDKRAS